MNSVEKSIKIGQFKEVIGYKGNEGANIKLYVEAYNNDSIIYQHLTDCRIYEDRSYDQETIEIYFDKFDVDYKKYGLRLSYNTNFHDFEFENNKLKIIDDKNSIVVIIWKL